MATGVYRDIDRQAAVTQDDPRRFAIRTRSAGAFALTADGAAEIDLAVRHAEVVQKKREKLVSDDEQLWIKGTASSTVEDRQGDVLNANCQAKMLSQASGLTLWLNHQYSVPEDILGVCLEPTLVQRAVGVGSVMDLDISVRVDNENPRAVKSWKHIAVSGVKLGFSIGGIFKDVDINPESDEDDWMPGLIVNDIELVEISLVGVPANPRAYTEFVSEMTRGFKSNIERSVHRLVPEGRRDRGALKTTASLVRKSLLRGVRPEDITMAKLTVPLSAYDDHGNLGLDTRAAGNREDAAADPEQQTIVENPNATATRDRPVKPEESANPQRHPNVGPPNSDEPLAVPMHGTPSVVGHNQPDESNVVSIDNSAPAPARHHGSQDDGLQGTTDQLPSRPEQHAEMGRVDPASGAITSSEAAPGKDKPTGATAQPGNVTEQSKPPAPGPKPSTLPEQGIGKPAGEVTGKPAEPSNAAKPTTDRAPQPPPVKDESKSLESIVGLVTAGTGKSYSMNDIAAIVKEAVADSESESPTMSDGDRVTMKAVRSMRAISRAAAHGVCSDSHAQLKRAHSAIKSVLPDDYELPEDASFPAYGAVTLSAGHIDAKHVNSLAATSAQLDADIAAKRVESERLDRVLTEKRATPLGRKSVATPSGSTGTGSKPTLSLADYNKSPQEINKAVNERVEGATVLQLSARDLSA
jgi:hypothetical protein